MSENKFELHLSQSFKLFQMKNQSNFFQDSKSKYQSNNYQNITPLQSSKAMKKHRQQKHINQHKYQQILAERSDYINNNQKMPHYKGTIEQSLLGKLKKLGYVSNPASKQNSPSSKYKNQHKRNISAGENKCEFKNRLAITTKQQNVKNNYLYKHVIGRGGFGKVWKVESKKDKKTYAMKEMAKALIITKKSVPSVMNEKKLLSQLNHPFLVNMLNSFQDRQTLYLVMDYLPGADLRYHISRKRRFTQQQAKFMICCILIGLQYLHDNCIIHRDIKPQNLVLDANGYIRITDLGIARKYRVNNSQDTSGTPGYMAPQILCRQNHTYAVDNFAVGVISYELMLRKRPYSGRSRKQIRDQIIARQVQVKKHQIPDNWSLQSADFINRLLQRKPNSRLGFNGMQQILNHPWLRQFPLDKLKSKQLKAPFLPDASLAYQQFDEGNISQENTQIKQLMHQNQIILRNNEVQQLFEGYQSKNSIQL